MKNEITRTRTRRKATVTPIVVESAPHDPNLRGQIITVYRENLCANEAKRAYEADRKALLAMMKDGGLQREEAQYTVDPKTGKEVCLVAEVSSPTLSVVDVRKLRTLVSDEQFMLIVSATQESVKEIVGTALLAQVLTSVPGRENVSVKVAK